MTQREKGKQMIDKVNEGMRRVVFQVPAPLVHAAQAAASKDLTTVSYICRKALARDLKERGLLPETVAD
jgi:hypothetical protein